MKFRSEKHWQLELGDILGRKVVHAKNMPWSCQRVASTHALELLVALHKELGSHVLGLRVVTLLKSPSSASQLPEVVIPLFGGSDCSLRLPH